MVFRNFLVEKVFFLQVAIVLTCFQSGKSQNEFDLMQNFLMKRFTKFDKINFWGSKTKKSHLSNFTFSFCLNLYRSTILHLIKTFCNKTFKKSIRIATKACNHAQIISSDLKPEVDTSLNISCLKVMITYYITKSYTFNIFGLISSIAIRHWNRNPLNPLYSFI